MSANSESNLKESKRERLKFLSLKSSCSCGELILCGYEGSEKAGLILASREDFNTFQPTQHFVHLSVPRALCSSPMSCSFHCHCPPGTPSSKSSNFFQCCPTLPFPSALIVFLHSSIWLMSQRNKNHSRDISDVWSYVSFLLFLPTSHGQSLEQGLLLLILFLLQSHTMAFQLWLYPRHFHNIMLLGTTTTPRIHALSFSFQTLATAKEEYKSAHPQ